ncbi:MAG: hypothetical protein KME08_11510 [Aphanothece sp. CMT-3BRIN-NPC111]|jgi:hypothetical protein|nr:hypothetical protein [Aphanothece sp. CMT-3BRIN-NPC111]
MRIPQLDLTNFELPFTFNNGIIEVGIAESYLAEPINAYIGKYEGQIRNTESEKIDVENLRFSFREGGFSLTGDVKVQFRRLLSEAPLIGEVYTPWMTIAGSFVEELAVDVVQGRLSVSHSQLHLSTTDTWYKNIFDEFVLPYLKEEVIKRINEQLSNFNGMTVEELILKYGSEKLKQRFGARIFGEDRINTLLKLADTGANRFKSLQRIKNKLARVRVNAKVSGEHLWLSIVSIPD